MKTNPTEFERWICHFTGEKIGLHTRADDRYAHRRSTEWADDRFAHRRSTECFFEAGHEEIKMVPTSKYPIKKKSFDVLFFFRFANQNTIEGYMYIYYLK